MAGRASSNSGALYLAMTSFVAEQQRVVADQAGIGRTAPLLRKLIAPQGAQQTSTDAPFRDFISGVGKYLFTPLAEAVVFAMLASYFLSRTVVPTPVAST